jgi:methionyl-tRNA formyltransferase
MQPWPTAYTFLHQPGRPPQRWIITRLQVGPEVPGSSPPAPPGTLLLPEEAPPGFPLAVRTGTNRLALITELQPAGKRRMSAAEFLRGHPLYPGARLGPEVEN